VVWNADDDSCFDDWTDLFDETCNGNKDYTEDDISNMLSDLKQFMPNGSTNEQFEDNLSKW
jgi:hypothetical protein